jgi:glycosyltransferase involved in cell wall biosynthesis
MTGRHPSRTVDLERFHPGLDGRALRHEVGVGAGGVLVGAVSRVLPWKGLGTLVEAAGLLKDKLPDTRYAIVDEMVKDRGTRARRSGNRDELPGLRDRLGLRERFHFVGWRDDVREALAAPDVAVHTAIEDPFPRVLIEAVACGKPIVATRGGGVPEMVGHEVTGYVIPPRHAAELASHKEMRGDPAIRSLLRGQAGRHRAERRFGLARCGEQVHAMVNGVPGRGW